jgi:hypothetical protein
MNITPFLLAWKPDARHRSLIWRPMRIDSVLMLCGTQI